MICMKNPFFLIPVALAALVLSAPPSTAVDLRADDSIPPVPPGQPLPPPLPPAAPPTTTSKFSAAQKLTTGQTKAHPGAPGDQRLEKLHQQLGLTPAQMTKLKPIFERAAQQLRALHSSVGLATAEKKQKARQIFVSSFQQIRPILTPQQLQKWKQLRDARHSAHTTTAKS